MEQADRTPRTNCLKVGHRCLVSPVDKLSTEMRGRYAKLLSDVSDLQRCDETLVDDLLGGTNQSLIWAQIALLLCPA
jgi:hypothetical protein